MPTKQLRAVAGWGANKECLFPRIGVQEYYNTGKPAGTVRVEHLAGGRFQLLEIFVAKDIGYDLHIEILESADLRKLVTLVAPKDHGDISYGCDFPIHKPLVISYGAGLRSLQFRVRSGNGHECRLTVA